MFEIVIANYLIFFRVFLKIPTDNNFIRIDSAF